MYKKILVIDNNDSFVYNIVEYLRELHTCDVTTILCSEVCDVINGMFPKYLDVYFSIVNHFDAIILSPGAGVPSDYSEMMEIVARLYDKIPILGICLGHQAIAVNFGLHLRKLDNPKHGHPSILHLVDNIDINSVYIKRFMDGVSQGSIIGRYHSWVVDMTYIGNGDALLCLGRDEDGNVMILAHKSLPIFGVQFHPESIISSKGRRLISNFIEIV